jgi:hypothetical protein
MYNRFTFAALFASLALHLGAPPRCHGQTAEELRAEIEQLLPAWRAALEAERAWMRESREDTVRLGTLTLLTRPANLQLVREVAAEAWQRLQTRLASDTTLLRGEAIVVSSLPSARWVSVGRQSVAYGSDGDVEPIAAAVVRELGRRLAERLADEQAFLLRGEVPLQDLSDEQRELVYIDLATADSRATRLCLVGQVRSCGDALAVGDLRDPVTVWYGAEERRRIVDRRRRRRYNRNPLADRCVDAGDDAACLEVLRAVPLSTLRPLSSAARTLLAEVALRLGGDGSYSRLIASQQPTLEGTLSEAARVPPDSLISAWREAVLLSRPREVALGALFGFSTLAWVVVLGAMATRSTRWR